MWGPKSCSAPDSSNVSGYSRSYHFMNREHMLDALFLLLAEESGETSIQACAMVFPSTLMRNHNCLPL